MVDQLTRRLVLKIVALVEDVAMQLRHQLASLSPA